VLFSFGLNVFAFAFAISRSCFEGVIVDVFEFSIFVFFLGIKNYLLNRIVSSSLLISIAIEVVCVAPFKRLMNFVVSSFVILFFLG
tara:strand:- start:14680 stop:14937 length:258 start_codon:yes stop_codon:yes gene_type:complete